MTENNNNGGAECQGSNETNEIENVMRAMRIPEGTIAASTAACRTFENGRGHAAKRVQLPKRITERIESIVAACDGRYQVSAKEILDVLKADGICKENAHANAVGDACGKAGLDLPSFGVGGKRYYDLTMICAGIEDREKRQLELDALSSICRRAAAGLLAEVSNGANH